MLGKVLLLGEEKRNDKVDKNESPIRWREIKETNVSTLEAPLTDRVRSSLIRSGYEY